MANDQRASNLFSPVCGGDKALNGSTSQQVKSGAGEVTGIHVNSSSSGTIKLWDSLAASGTVLVNTYSAVVGWNPMPMPFSTGLYITVGGTIDYTVVYS